MDKEYEVGRVVFSSEDLEPVGYLVNETFTLGPLALGPLRRSRRASAHDDR
jgi:hypothetical protein